MGGASSEAAAEAAAAQRRLQAAGVREELDAERAGRGGWLQPAGTPGGRTVRNLFRFGSGIEGRAGQRASL